MYNKLTHQSKRSDNVISILTAVRFVENNFKTSWHGKITTKPKKLQMIEK